MADDRSGNGAGAGEPEFRYRAPLCRLVLWFVFYLAACPFFCMSAGLFAAIVRLLAVHANADPVEGLAGVVIVFLTACGAATSGGMVQGVIRAWQRPRREVLVLTEAGLVSVSLRRRQVIVPWDGIREIWVGPWPSVLQVRRRADWTTVGPYVENATRLAHAMAEKAGLVPRLDTRLQRRYGSPRDGMDAASRRADRALAVRAYFRQFHVAPRRLAANLVVTMAIAVVAWWGGPKVALGWLTRQVVQGSEDGKSMALLQLGLYGPKAAPALDAICAALDDPDIDVACWASFALPRVDPGGSRAVPALTQALQSADDNHVQLASLALAKYGSRAVPILEQHVRDHSGRSARSACFALCEIGPEAVPSLMRLARGPRPDIRGAAARALGAMGRDAAPAEDVLRGLLHDPDATVRKKAAYALDRVQRRLPPLSEKGNDGTT